MTVFRVAITSSQRQYQFDDKGQGKVYRVCLPQEIVPQGTMFKFMIPSNHSFVKHSTSTLPFFPQQLTQSSKHHGNFSVLVNIPLSPESSASLDLIRRELMQKDSFSAISYAHSLNIRGTEKIWQSEAEVGKTSNTSKLQNMNKKRRKREEIEVETVPIPVTSLNLSINSLVEAFQWVLVVHLLFYSFVLGFVFGILFVTDINPY